MKTQSIFLIMALFIATLSAAGVPAESQTLPEKTELEDDLICLTVARYWRGSHVDIRNITSNPIPKSFRDAFEAGGCTRFQLVETSLIDWHLAYGTVDSTLAALRYLETGYGINGDKPNNFKEVLELAWERAKPDIESLRELKQKKDETAFASLQESSIPLRNLYNKTNAASNYLQMAELYVASAEFFLSDRFVPKANYYLKFIEIRGEFFQDKQEPKEFVKYYLPKDQSWIAYPDNYADRIANLESRISGKNVTTEQAWKRRSEVRRREDVWQAGRYILTDNAEYSPREKEIEDRYPILAKTLGEDDNFFRYATDYWETLAHMELLTQQDVSDRCEPESYRPALALLSAENRDGRDADEIVDYFSGGWPRRSSDRLIALRLARMDCLIKMLTSENANEMQRALGNIVFQVENEAQKAMLHFMPYEAPNRFRQLIIRLNRVEKACRKLATDGERDYRCHMNPKRRAFYRLIEQNLDRLVLAR